MAGLLANPQVNGLIFSLGAMQVARKIDFEQKSTLDLVRIGYVVAQALVLGAYFFASTKIKAKNDLKVLKYVEPKSPMQQDPGAMITTTNRDYDLSEISKGVRGVLIGIAFMCFMHGYMKYTQPLFIQAIMAIKALYDSKILKIHLLGKPAVDDLQRPFVAPASFLTPAPAAEPVAVEAKKDK